jgi:hypothetical protein
MWILWKNKRFPLLLTKIVMLCLLMLTTRSQAESNDLQRLGPVYPILEPDWRIWLPKQLERKLPRHDSQWWQKRFEEVARRQTPQLDLPEVKIASKRTFDLKVNSQKPVMDRLGHLTLVPVTVNPIALMSLSRPILVLDGRSDRQVDLARRRSKKSMIVLITAGDPARLARLLGQPAYPVPQKLLAKYQISRVPVLISQQGTELTVEELVP